MKVHEVNGKLCLQACENISPGTELLFWLKDNEISNDLDAREEKLVVLPGKPCQEGIYPKPGDDEPSGDNIKEQESSGMMEHICFCLTLVVEHIVTQNTLQGPQKFV